MDPDVLCPQKRLINVISLSLSYPVILNHWGRVTHICVCNLTIIGSDNGLSPGRRQAIIWTNAGILLIRPLRTNFSEILIEILTPSLKKMGLKVLSTKWRPFCLSLQCVNPHDAETGIFWDKLVNTMAADCHTPCVVSRHDVDCVQYRLLHSPSLVAIGLSVGYETWPPISEVQKCGRP